MLVQTSRSSPPATDINFFGYSSVDALQNFQRRRVVVCSQQDFPSLTPNFVSQTPNTAILLTFGFQDPVLDYSLLPSLFI